MNYLNKKDAMKIFEEDIVFNGKCDIWLKDTILSFLNNEKPSVLYPITPYYKSYLSLNEILLDFANDIRKEKKDNELFSPYTIFCDSIATLSSDRELLANPSVSNVLYFLIFNLKINKAISNLIKIVLYENLNYKLATLNPTNVFYLLKRIKSIDNNFLEYYRKYIPVINDYYSLSISLLKELILLDDNIDNIIEYINYTANAINKFKDNYKLKDNDKKFIELKKIINRKFWTNSKITNIYDALMQNNLIYLTKEDYWQEQDKEINRIEEIKIDRTDKRTQVSILNKNNDINSLFGGERHAA